MKKYEKIRKYDGNIWKSVGGDFGDDWVHHYYRFKNYRFKKTIVSVYSDEVMNGNFSVAVFTIKDLRRKHDWYDKRILEINNATLDDVVDIIELVEHGKI